MRFFLIGFMGSGKSHWGQQLSREFKMPYIDLDEAIVQDMQMDITEIFSRFGEEYFRKKEKELLEKLVLEHPSLILSCGGGTPCFFNNIEFMKASGTVVWLNTRVEVLLERLIEGRKNRPVLKDIADADLKDTIIRKLNERRMYYDQAHIVIDNESSISTGKFIQTILHA